MKLVIKEYAEVVLALFATGTLFVILGNLLFEKQGMLAQLMNLVLSGGV